MKRGTGLSRNIPLTARTPLRTHTGLQASGSWSRSVPLLTTTKSAARKGHETGFSRTVRLGVRKRAGRGFIDDATCEACGRWLGRYEGEVQHRAARGAGGCTDEVIGSFANAALLCGHGAAPIRSGCHGRCEDRKPDMGMNEAGFWIEHGTTPDYDPRNVGILLASPHGSGMRVWLAADGKGPNGDGYLTERPGAWAA